MLTNKAFTKMTLKDGDKVRVIDNDKEVDGIFRD